MFKMESACSQLESNTCPIIDYFWRPIEIKPVTVDTVNETYPIGTDEPITPDPSGQRQLEAYPNPTPGDFTLEMEGVWSIGMKKAILYNLHRRKGLARDVGGPGKYTLSLAGVPTGIYVIHVTGDGESGSVRIVKK